MAVRRKLYEDDAIREQFTQPAGEPTPMPDTGIAQPVNTDIDPQEVIARASDPNNAHVMGTDPRRQQVADAYKKYLGRDAGESELGTHLGKGANVDESVRNIQGSEEARNYAAKRPAMTASTPSNAAAGVGNTAGGIGPSGAVPGEAGYGAAETGAPGAAGADNSGGMAGGYDYIPGAEEIQWGDTSRLSGFNTNEWGAGGSEGYDEFSYKNTFGKIASRYDPTPDSARQLVNDPDFKKMFPRAELIDHPTDPKIKFEPGDPPVDVLAASGAGGWQWLPEGGDGGGGGMMPGQVPGDLSGIIASGEGDILAEIQKQLASTAQGRTPFLDDALTKEFSV